jgi:hypothetical protein
MGKILESMGLIQGYDVTKVGKGTAKKDKLFVEIEKKDSEIKEKVRELVNNNSGRVYAITKKGLIRGLYLYKLETKNKQTILVHMQKLFTDDVSPEVQEKYDDFYLKLAESRVKYQEYDKVVLEDKVIQIDPTKTRKEIALTLFTGFLMGFVFGWLIFDDIFMGVLYGIILGPTFSSLEIVATTRNQKKK